MHAHKGPRKLSKLLLRVERFVSDMPIEELIERTKEDKELLVAAYSALVSEYVPLMRKCIQTAVTIGAFSFAALSLLLMMGLRLESVPIALACFFITIFYVIGELRERKRIERCLELIIRYRLA